MWNLYVVSESIRDGATSDSAIRNKCTTLVISHGRMFRACCSSVLIQKHRDVHRKGATLVYLVYCSLRTRRTWLLNFSVLGSFQQVTYCLAIQLRLNDLHHGRCTAFESKDE